MKTTLFLAVLLFSQFSAAAPRADYIKKFLGKFTATEASCPNFEGDRIYISLQEDFAGNDILELNFYGQDAAMEEFLLDSGERPAPGGPRGTIQSWETYFVQGDNLFSVVKTFALSGKDYTETAELSLRDGGKTVIYSTENPWRSVKCEMKRVN